MTPNRRTGPFAIIGSSREISSGPGNHDVLAAELGTLHEGMADARKHFPEPETDLTLADLLGTPLDPFGRLVQLGLVGSPGRPARIPQNASDTDVRPCVRHLTPCQSQNRTVVRPSFRSVRLHSPRGAGIRVAVQEPMHTPRPQDRRQYPRTRVCWPMIVQAGASRYLTSSVDISPFGAKVRTKARLKTGTS